jgi:hypothetical protein
MVVETSHLGKIVFLKLTGIIFLSMTLGSCGGSSKGKRFQKLIDEVKEAELISTPEPAPEIDRIAPDFVQSEDASTQVNVRDVTETTAIVNSSIISCSKDEDLQESPDYINNLSYYSFERKFPFPSLPEGEITIAFFVNLRLYSVLDKLTAGDNAALSELLYYYSVPLPARIRDFLHSKGSFLYLVPHTHWGNVMVMYNYLYLEIPTIHTAVYALRPDETRKNALTQNLSSLTPDELETFNLYNTPLTSRVASPGIRTVNPLCNSFTVGINFLTCFTWYTERMKSIIPPAENPYGCPFPTDPFLAESEQTPDEIHASPFTCYYLENELQSFQTGDAFELKKAVNLDSKTQDPESTPNPPQPELRDYPAIVCEQRDLPAPPPDLFPVSSPSPAPSASPAPSSSPSGGV